MRISVTDRCNLRCLYCMPDGVKQVPMEEILTLEEYAFIARQAADLGIRKIKITGGEPLVRLGCCQLIHMLKHTPGIEKVTITTNGMLLETYLDDLMDAGIDGINISLDTLDKDLDRALTGRGDLETVLRALKRAVKACQGRRIPIKLNAVSLDLKALAEQLGCPYGGPGWAELLDIARQYPVDVRFIEMMPIGFGRQYRSLDHGAMLKELRRLYPDMETDDRIHGNGPAVYYRIPGFLGSVGFISAIHGKFCHSCNRVRLTSRGYVKSCLCYEDGEDLRAVLRGAGTERERALQVKEAVKRAVLLKPGAHCFEDPRGITEQQSMARIGG